jgi:hypothetical protein
VPPTSSDTRRDNTGQLWAVQRTQGPLVKQRQLEPYLVVDKELGQHEEEAECIDSCREEMTPMKKSQTCGPADPCALGRTDTSLPNWLSCPAAMQCPGWQTRQHPRMS